MNDPASSLLIYPFQKGILEWPKEALFYGASFFPQLHDFEKKEIIQPFKPKVDVLEENKIFSTPTLSNEKKYPSICCALPKQKEESLFILANALNHLEKNGLLLAYASNDAGGKRIKDFFDYFGLAAESLSKNKCKIVWAYKTNMHQDKVDKCIKNGSEQQFQHDDETYATKPGIYSWRKIDKGSELLSGVLPDNLSGVGADFGCGYGYLSKQVLLKNKSIKKINVIDADYHALSCCRTNLHKHTSDFEIEYHWEDLNMPVASIKNLDWIIMNPPFHEDKNADMEIGQNFIKSAASSLKAQGKLLIVANLHLPYEKTLNENFSKVEKITEKQGFKVIFAEK